jgi:hypothetical protein
MRKDVDAEIICPTCGTAHFNDFSNKFGLISDAESCRGFLFEVKQELVSIDQLISTEREKFHSFSEHINRINLILNEERGELKLRDLIEGESERLVDVAISQERQGIDARVGEQEIRSDKALEIMKSFEDRKFQKTIKDKYFHHMREFVSELNVPGLSEQNYKRIDCNIHETGSDLPRALLAYYYAFVHTMRGQSKSALCPLIVDSPVQQDQDPENAARIINFALNRVPENMQLVLGTVSLHGVKYDGHVIDTRDKLRLLSKSAFDEVSEIMKPYYAKLLQTPS